MNWNDLRYFLAIARTGSLTGASKALGVSQSTVSRRIEALEGALATRLFERRADGYLPTESGRAMLERAAGVEDHLKDLENELTGRDTAPFGSVRIASIETLANLLIIPNVARFHASYPALRLELAVHVARQHMPRRETDVALRLSRPEQGNYTVKRLGALGFGLYAGVDYLKRHPNVMDRSRIPGRHIIGWSDELSYIAMAKLRQLWSDGAEPSLMLDTLHAHCLAAKVGLGMAVLPCFLADGEAALRRIAGNELYHSENIWLVVHSDIRHAKRVRTVCDFLTELVEGHRTALAGGAGCESQAPADETPDAVC